MLASKLAKTGAEDKVAGLLIMIIFLSFLPSFRLLGLMAVILLVYCLLVARRNPLKLVKPVLPFVLLMLVPLLLDFLLGRNLDNLEFTGLIISKVLISSLMLGLVVNRFSSLYLVEGILNMGFPQLFNRILMLTFRYFHMINQDVEMGRLALASRGLNERNLALNLKIFGQWIGGFFLKSSDHSEMVFLALKARGFDGQARGKKSMDGSFLLRNFLLVLLLVIILFLDRRF